MGQAYTPGLKVSARTAWTCRRMLAVPGQVLVQLGQAVTAQTPVARTELPGDATPMNFSKVLAVSPAEVASCLKVTPGSAVVAGQRLAEKAGLFGWFRSEVLSPVNGTLESVSSVTGQAILRGAPQAIELLAYLQGTVTEVIPQRGCQIQADVALIQGIFGIGGEAYGLLQPISPNPQSDLHPEDLTAAHRGHVVVAGRRMTKAAVDRARQLGVSAIIAGGIDDQDLKDILGYDLGVAVTGSESLGITLIITEGFGEIAMAQRTFDLLQRHQGRPVAVNGTTQIRAGVLRPEVVIPLTESGLAEPLHQPQPPILQCGASVRIIREPDFGALAKVTGLPTEPQWLASESKARVVQLQLQDNRVVTVPRANVELIEEA
jgi:hypothetical protein